MRILLASNASYVPPRGGSTRSNLVWLDQLSAAGHECQIVATAAASNTSGKREQVEVELRQQEIPADSEIRDGVAIAHHNGIEVHSVIDPCAGARYWSAASGNSVRTGCWSPPKMWAKSCCAPPIAPLPDAWCTSPTPPQFYPFGPASWNPDPQAAEIIRRAAAVVAIGHRTAAYIQSHIGVQPAVVHPPMYGPGPFPALGSFDSGLITIINPCAVKGISIFLALADAHPQLAFGALPGWGTTASDLQALSARPNIELLPKVKDIEQLLRRTRVLLVPSLWLEGFGLVVTEALLRAIPVIASDSGGLVEAKLGTGFIIPVRPIERFEPVFDEHAMPKPILPPQDIAPWSEALLHLLSDANVYQRESAQSHAAANEFVAALDPARLEKLLLALPAPRSEPPPAPSRSLEDLSPAKRALLLQRLKAKHN
jgi:Glycosyltransferase